MVRVRGRGLRSRTVSAGDAAAPERQRKTREAREALGPTTDAAERLGHVAEHQRQTERKRLGRGLGHVARGSVHSSVL